MSKSFLLSATNICSFCNLVWIYEKPLYIHTVESYG